MVIVDGGGASTAAGAAVILDGGGALTVAGARVILEATGPPRVTRLGEHI